MGGVAGCMHASVSGLGASGILLLVPMGMMLHHALGYAPPGNMYSGVRLSFMRPTPWPHAGTMLQRHARVVSPRVRPPPFWEERIT